MEVVTGETIVKIASGSDHIVCLTEAGSLLTLGTKKMYLSPASLAGAGDIETHRVRPSVCPSVRSDEFVQAISQLLGQCQ